MNRSPFSNAIVAAVLLLFAQSAFGGIVTATKGKFTGRVSVTGGGASQTKTVEQSAAPAGTNFVDTGFTVTTNASGAGTVSIPNTASGTLLVGHNVRLVCPGNVICGPVPVTATSKWFASFVPGIEQDVSILVDQAVIGTDGLELLETWEPGAIWTLRLDPSEASWVDTGIASISSVQGDLAASILSITTTDIAFQISSDATPLTSNSILLDGIRLNVPSPSTTLLHTFYGLQGDVDAFLDGQFLSSQSFSTPTFVQATSITAVPEPSTMTLLMAGAITALAFRGSRLFRTGRHRNADDNGRQR